MQCPIRSFPVNAEDEALEQLVQLEVTISLQEHVLNPNTNKGIKSIFVHADENVQTDRMEERVYTFQTPRSCRAVIKWMS